MTGPVSAAIEQEVLGELRRQGIVVWLDKDGSYTSFVDELVEKQRKGVFPFSVVGFRGSFLSLLFELEPHGSGLDKQPLLIHMPGFNEESIRKTPVLELYEPGVRFRKGLDTLIREAATARVPPAEVERFVAQKPSLQQADAWLATAVSQNSFGFEAALREFGPRMLVESLVQTDSTIRQRVRGEDELCALRRYAHSLTGVDDSWIAEYAAKEDAFKEAERQKPLDVVLSATAAWSLAVEYVHDLKRPPHLAGLQRLRDLSEPLVKASRELLTQLRREHGDAYVRIADEVEGFLHDELRAMTPDDLGQVDTFREEESRVLSGAVEALSRRDWSKAKSWCDARHGEKSFWLQRDQSRRWAWSLVAEAAAFGETIARHPHPLAHARSLGQAAEVYASSAFEVDRAHRRFEQQRLKLLEPRLPHFGPLQEVVGDLRRAHRAWADDLAKNLAALCVAQGFLPEPSLQQRTLYEQVVHPLTVSNDKVAFFVIDAFRYEMATELVEELEGAGTVVDLKPRFAELPTITSVGMNALAPVAQTERLSVAGVFQGFKTGEFTVRKPDDRSKAMGLRSTGKAALRLSLTDVCEKPTAELIQKTKSHSLVVVHSKEIDDAGEANLGVATFESTLRQIKAAWHHLQLAGFKAFVFSADHGFLMQDETTLERPFGKKSDPQRRHVLDEHPRAEEGMVNVALSALGYDGLTGYLLFRTDTAIFATGNPGATFVHGGNSLQERLIPVLTVTKKKAETSSLAEYAVEVEHLPGVMGLHRVRARVVFERGTTTSLGFAAARSIALELRAKDRDQVRVLLKDVAGPVQASLKAGRLELPVGEAWTEVFFSLEGPVDERVRVEALHPDAVEKVTGASPDQWYAVSGRAAPAPTKKPKRASDRPPVSGGWADSIEDEGVRKVFLHVEKHGIINEMELVALLGTPRSARHFAGRYEQYTERLPFKIRVESGAGGKSYVREGEK